MSHGAPAATATTSQKPTRSRRVGFANLGSVARSRASRGLVLGLRALRTMSAATATNVTAKTMLARAAWKKVIGLPRMAGREA